MVADLATLATAWTRAIGATERRLARFKRTRDRRDYYRATEAGRREDAARRAYQKAGGPLPVPRFPRGRVSREGVTPRTGNFGQPDANTGHPRKGLGLSAWWAKRKKNNRGEGTGATAHVPG
jgi:DNA-binding PadR family transcriptional regulator